MGKNDPLGIVQIELRPLGTSANGTTQSPSERIRRKKHKGMLWYKHFT